MSDWPEHQPGQEARHATRAARFYLGLILALGLIFLASLSRAADAPTGLVDPCLAPHGDRGQYRQGLSAGGWQDIAEEERPGALAALTDAFLPVIGQIEGTWAERLASRPQAVAFWEDLARNRTLMEREGGLVLLLAGFANEKGEMLVECWVAAPSEVTTDPLFDLLGTAYDKDGVKMTQVNLPADATRPATEIFVSHLTPPDTLDPPLAARHGLRTRITFPLPQPAP